LRRRGWDNGLSLGVFNSNQTLHKARVLMLFAGHVTTSAAAAADDGAHHGQRGRYTIYSAQTAARSHVGSEPRGPEVGLLIDCLTVHNQIRFLNASEGPDAQQVKRPPNAILLNLHCGGVPCLCVVAAREIGPREEIHAQFASAKYWDQTRQYASDLRVCREMRAGAAQRAFFSAAHGR
jgi:hypothetical protein